MSRIFSPHPLELQPGVDPAEFETFVKTELIPLYNQWPGLTVSLLKGDRGLHTGKYALLIETDSVERRDYYFPVSNIWPDEIQRFLAETAPAWEKMDQYVVEFPSSQSTDFVVLET